MNSNTLAACCHLLSFTGYLGNGVGFVIGPLILWLIKKDSVPEVNYHGQEALNFNISIFIYSLALGVMCFLTLGLGVLIAIPGFIGLVILHFVCTILAAIKANNGETYRYPMTLRLI